MSKIFIIHGSFGNPSENWFPWLKNELEDLGHEVYIPKFPTPENQNLKNWNDAFATLLQKVDKDSFLIGHSLGPAFILNVLEQINVEVSGCAFASGFIDLLDNETFDGVNKTFVDRKFNWAKIKSNCKNFQLYHGENDPYVPVECAKKLALKLDTDVLFIPNGGHLNQDSGYIMFEKLLKDVKSNL